MPDQSPLDQLPQQLAALTTAVAQAAETLKQTSRERWFLPPGQAFWFQVRSAGMAWRISVSRQDSETFFFFFTREKPPYVTLDALIQTSMRLGLPGETPGPGPDLLPWSVRYPAFFVLDMSDADFALFTPPGSTRQDTIVLALDEGTDDLLAILFNKKKKQMLYSSGRVPGQVQDGSYSVSPLLDLIDTLAGWSLRGSPAGPQVAVSSGNQNTVVHEILDQVSEGYLASQRALAQFPGFPVPHMEPDYYRLGDYEADIELRLKKDGSLSEKPEQESFRLRLRLRLRDVESISPEIVVSPSGLFVSGALYNSFFDNLANFGASAFLAARLGNLIRETSDQFRRIRAQEFAVSARANSRVLLAGNGIDDPLYLLLLRGSLYDEPTTLLMVAEFKTESDTTVTWNLEGIMDTLIGFTGDPRNLMLERSDADYIFTIIENIKRWGELL